MNALCRGLKLVGVACLIGLLGACATSDPKDKYDIQQTEVLVTLIPYTKDFTSAGKGSNSKIFGEAVVSDGKCTIRLREYPKFLLHEIRHCFEGLWHKKEQPNDDDGEAEDIEFKKGTYEVSRTFTESGVITATVSKPSSAKPAIADSEIKTASKVAATN